MPSPHSDTTELRNKIIKQLNRICREEYGGNASRMAEDAQVSQSKMSRLLHGKGQKIDPYLGVAADIANAQSIDLSQITTPKPTSEDTHSVHAFRSVKVGARDTRPMEDWPYENVNIPTRIGRQLVGQEPPDDVGLVQVKGESMYPEIQNGDWVLFTPCNELVDGGTFLIRLDGALLLKNLQRKAGNRVRIHSFNESFDDDFIRQVGSGEWVTDDRHEHPVAFEVVGRFLNVIQPKELFRSSQRVKEAIKAHASMTTNGNGVK